MLRKSIKYYLPAVNPFLFIIFSWISSPAMAQRQGMLPLHAKVLGPGRLSVQAGSQFSSSGRPQRKSFLRVWRLAIAEGREPECNNRDWGVSFWRVVAKKIANWRMSADEIAMQVVKWFIQSLLIELKVNRGPSKLKSGFEISSKKLFSGWRLSIEEEQAEMREVMYVMFLKNIYSPHLRIIEETSICPTLGRKSLIKGPSVVKCSPRPLRKELGGCKYINFHHINKNIHLTPTGNLQWSAAALFTR